MNPVYYINNQIVVKRDIKHSLGNEFVVEREKEKRIKNKNF